MIQAQTAIKSQTQLFDSLLDAAAADWPPLVCDGEKLESLCSTLVMRPGQTSALEEAVAALKERFPGHTYYGAENFHLTVFGLPMLKKSDALSRHLDRFLKSHTPALRPLSMPLSGLSIIGNTIVARCLDTNGLLSRFVNACLDELSEELGEGVDSLEKLVGLHRQIYWITLARMTGHTDSALLDFVREESANEFGISSFARMQVVETDLLFSVGATKVVKEYDLGFLT